MRVVRGWSTATLVAREEVFDGLITKAVRMTLRPITLSLSTIVVASGAKQLIAAGGPQLSTSDSDPAPIITMTAGGTITALWDGYVDNELVPYLQQTYLDAAAHILTGMESALDGSIPQITDGYAQQYLANATNRLKGISDTIWQTVRAELQLGLDDGEGMQQLAARVRKTANVMPARAMSIARTEVHNAAEAGSLAQVQLGGFTDEECSKRWLATDDVRTREAHRKADGQVVGLNQPFIVGGEGMQRPGDPLGSAENVIQCRCTMEFLFTDDADLDDLDDELSDELITAAKSVKDLGDDWEELEHPRGPDGKFIKKGTVEYFTAVDAIKKAKAQAKVKQSTTTEAEPDFVNALIDQVGLAKATQPKKKSFVAKPLKINTNVIYKTEYGDGAVVAERVTQLANGVMQERLVWNAQTKKFDYQGRDSTATGDGTLGPWITVESHGKGSAYQKFKDQTDWTTPVIALQEAAEQVAAMQKTPDAAPKPMAKPFLKDPANLGVMTTSEIDLFYSNLTPAVFQSYTADEKDVVAKFATTQSANGNDWPSQQVDAALAAQVQVGKIVDPDDVANLISGKPNIDVPAVNNIPALMAMPAPTFNAWFSDNFLDEADQGLAKWQTLNVNQQAALTDKAELVQKLGHPTPLSIIKNAYQAGPANATDDAEIPYPDFEDMHIVALNTWFDNLTKEQYDNFEEWEQEGIWDEAKAADDDFGNPKPIESLQALTGQLAYGQAPTFLPNFAMMSITEQTEWFDQFTQSDYDKLTSDEVLKVVSTSAKLNAAGVTAPFKKISKFSDNTGPMIPVVGPDTDSSLDDDMGFLPANFSVPTDINAMSPVAFKVYLTDNKDVLQPPNEPSDEVWAVAVKYGLVSWLENLANQTAPASVPKSKFKLPDEMNADEFKAFVKTLPPLTSPSDMYWDTAEKLGITPWAEQHAGMPSPHGTGSLVVKGQSVDTKVPDKLNLAGMSQPDAMQAVHAFVVAKTKPAHDIGVPSTVTNETVFKSLTKTKAAKIQEDMLAESGVTWTPAQLAAVQQYTTSVGYQTSNAVLRNDQKRMKLFSSDQLAAGAERAITLQTAMTPLTENVLLHRGTGAHAFGFSSVAVDTNALKKLEGKVIKDRAFSSTSVISPKGEVGFDYASKPIKVLIQAPKGTPGLYVSSATPGWSKENEFIIGAGSNYRIDHVREATADDKNLYGDGIKQVVVMTIVPDDGTPTDQIHAGDKIKTPAGPKVTPAPVAPTPPTKSIVVKPAIGKSVMIPIKLNTKTIHSTKYSPGAIVAVRVAPVNPGGNPVPQRLVWVASAKKFSLQVPSNAGDGSWMVAKLYTKKDAYDAFKNDDNWFTPKVGVDAYSSAGDFGTPTAVAQSFGSPSPAPVTVVPPAPVTVTAPQSIAGIIGQYGDLPPSIGKTSQLEIYKEFKTTSGYGTMMLSKPSDVVFKALAKAVASWNKNNPIGSGKHVNHLQILKMIDTLAAEKIGVSNTNAYEKKIVDWLQTSGGKKQAPDIIKLAQAGTLAPSPATLSPAATAAAELAAAMAKIPNAYDISVPSSDEVNFPNMPPSQAAAMNTAMRKKFKITAEHVSAVKDYTGSGSTAINEMLRYPGKGYQSVNTARKAQLIQESMYPVPKSMTVHRGTSMLGNDIPENISISQLQQLVGKTFSDGSFFSASVGDAAAFSSKRFQLEIEVPTGTPAAYVNPISTHKQEKEIILAAGLHYQIVGVVQSGHQYKVRLRVVKPK